MTVSTVTLTPSTPGTPRVLGAGAVAEQHPAHHDLIRRVSQPGYQWWLTHVMSAAACSRPVRLKLEAHWHGSAGTEIDQVTAGMPDGALYVACKNRRTSVCPACAQTYRADTYQLVKAGLVGGKGVPETVSEHPCLFVTLTAPSFGLVHTRVIGHNGQVRPCRARRNTEPCPHGRPQTCLERHHEHDPRVGEPICRDCYDYRHQAAWNFHAGELWRRTTIALNRALAHAGRIRDTRVRLSFAKVAEYQRRGVIHFHALIRLDGRDLDNPDAILAPDPSITIDHLRSYVDHAAASTSFTTEPHPVNPSGWPIHWGAQVDIRTVKLSPADADDHGTLTTTAVAAYLAKYATKATEETGHISRRLDSLGIDLHTEHDTHQARQLLACWELGSRPLNCRTKAQREAWAQGWRKLQKWAHMLGYGGHFSTKSRRYSTTLGALRAVRKAFKRGDPIEPAQPELPHDADPDGDDSIVTLNWIFDGVGWLTLGDAMLANTAAAKARERKQIAREEVEEAIGK
ncbi:plasmid replication initiator protein [Amycolatopsis oliviviridis]|uniref:Replication initiation protein n=2 Tax=Amycolatopsis oliviviridis TaxID=1471590 RepID=A0ABQ3LMY0_9PSEU|nr:replication initiator [Amycolatopsis oliviviridis]GHH20847.1 replication initiation protein [Amycolatopsis oliviviridis]